MVGVQLLSDAIVEQRGTFKMVAMVTAPEAWLLERRQSAQTFRHAESPGFACHAASLSEALSARLLTAAVPARSGPSGLMRLRVSDDGSPSAAGSSA
jgi:hypothetical protein